MKKCFGNWDQRTWHPANCSECGDIDTCQKAYNARLPEWADSKTPYDERVTHNPLVHPNMKSDNPIHCDCVHVGKERNQQAYQVCLIGLGRECVCVWATDNGRKPDCPSYEKKVLETKEIFVIRPRRKMQI